MYTYFFNWKNFFRFLTKYLIIAGVYKVLNARFNIVAVFHESHVAHMVEEEYFGVVREHGLRDGNLEGNTVVVLAIDKKHRHLQLLKDTDAGRACQHALLCRNDGFGTGLKTLVLKVLDVLRQGSTAGFVEERGNEVDDIGSAVLEHLLADRPAAFLMVLAVGEGMRIDKSESAERIGVLLGKGQGDIATHGMSYHNTLVNTGFIEHCLHDSRHEIHRMHFGETFGMAVSRKIDGNNTQVVHVGEHVGAPYIEALQEAMEQDYHLAIAATLVAVMNGTAVNHDNTVLFHNALVFIVL